MAVLQRRTGIVSVATLSGLALAVGLTQAIAPDWSRSYGLDLWCSSDCIAEYHEGYDRLKDQLQSSETLNRQMELSEYIASQLIEDQITLAEAINELEIINRDRIGFQDSLRTAYGDLNDRERLALYALAKVQRQLESDPSTQAIVLVKLEQQYLNLLGKLPRQL